MRGDDTADMKTSMDVGEMVGDVGNTRFMLGRWWGTPSKWQLPRDVGSRGRGDLGGC
jgi:hypothetical protein